MRADFWHIRGAAIMAAMLPMSLPVMAQDANAPGPSPIPPATDREPAPSVPGGREVYTPADFARFAPRSALDLIQQIPGFAVQEETVDETRGFGEASGNLLINGDRISSKSTSVSSQLSRIPVATVLRIEILDGAALNIPGLSGRVANIIVESGGLSGQFTWRAQVLPGAGPRNYADGNASISGSAGPVDYTVALTGGGVTRGGPGPAIFTLPTGVVDERAHLQRSRTLDPVLSGTFSFDVAPGVVANLNLSGGLTRLRSWEVEQRLPPNPFPPLQERYETQDDAWFREIGGDVEFPVGPGRLKVIALDNRGHGHFRTQSLIQAVPEPDRGQRFENRSDEGERIARGEYKWPMANADWQISAEAAFNRFDQSGSLLIYDPDQAGYVPVPFPRGRGGVREDRYESILSISRPFGNRLSVQLAAGAEHSTISQTGANALSRRFARPKGALSLAWAASPSTDVSLEIARRVGQLEFADFLASVSLTDDNQNAGNNQLRPQQSWETALEIARNFGPLGSATLRLFDERLEDLVLYVPVSGGLEARGNIDGARRFGVNFDGTLQLEPLGFRGAKVNARLDAERSRLVDPVTSVPRRFDSSPTYEVYFDFRHDVPATHWAWGFEVRDTDHVPRYRLAERALDFRVRTFGAVFLEHKNVLGLTVNARLANIFKEKSVLVRTLYAGSRAEPAILFTEERRLKVGRIFSLLVSGSF